MATIMQQTITATQVPIRSPAFLEITNPLQQHQIRAVYSEITILPSQPNLINPKKRMISQLTIQEHLEIQVEICLIRTSQPPPTLQAKQQATHYSTTKTQPKTRNQIHQQQTKEVKAETTYSQIKTSQPTQQVNQIRLKINRH